jgi:hypothetical protein
MDQRRCLRCWEVCLSRDGTALDGARRGHGVAERVGGGCGAVEVAELIAQWEGSCSTGSGRRGTVRAASHGH